MYEITEQGRVALTDAKAKVKELFGELIEDAARTGRPRKRTRA